MPQINSIQLHLQTGDLSGAGTDGDVYLGVCGREFSIDTTSDDFEGAVAAATSLVRMPTSAMRRSTIRASKGCSPRTWRGFRSTSASSRKAGATTGNWCGPTYASTILSTSTGIPRPSFRSVRKGSGWACDRVCSCTCSTSATTRFRSRLRTRLGEALEGTGGRCDGIDRAGFHRIARA